MESEDILHCIFTLSIFILCSFTLLIHHISEGNISVLLHYISLQATVHNFSE